jgi:hypothetical protein
VWATREEVAVAAMTVGALKEAELLVADINGKFGGGARAARLQGMLQEASGRMDQAEAVYKAQLEKDPQNQMHLKRMVRKRND